MKFMMMLLFISLGFAGFASAEGWPQRMTDLPKTEIIKINQQFKSAPPYVQAQFPSMGSFQLKFSYDEYAEYSSLGGAYVCDQGANIGMSVQDEFVIMVPMSNTFFNYFQHSACTPKTQD